MTTAQKALATNTLRYERGWVARSYRYHNVWIWVCRVCGHEAMTNLNRLFRDPALATWQNMREHRPSGCDQCFLRTLRARMMSRQHRRWR